MGEEGFSSVSRVNPQSPLRGKQCGESSFLTYSLLGWARDFQASKKDLAAVNNALTASLCMWCSKALTLVPVYVCGAAWY